MLRVKRYSYDKSEFLSKLIDNGKKHLAELIDYFDLSFDDQNEKTDAVLAELGGMDAFKEQMKGGFNPDDLCEKKEFKITELTDDGFYARTISGEIKKVKFNRVD